MNEHESFFEELKCQVDADHRRLDGASAPPASMWKSIRAQAQPETNKEETTMIHSNSIVSSPYSATGPVSKESGGFRHTLSLAASFLIVMSVALGGWFATMQLSQPPDDSRFAMLPVTPDVASATCDVEPMTVDEVMEIAENPYRYLDESDYPQPWGTSNPPTPWEDEYQEVQPRLPISLNTGLDTQPTQTAFDESYTVISKYLGCMQTDGSVAMMLRFSDPFSIQYHIRTNFPFYRSEEQVRVYVTEWLELGEPYHAMTYERNGETLTYRPAQDKSMAGTQVHDFGLGFDQVIYVGSEIYDERGDFVGNFHPGLYMTYGVDQEYLDYGVVFTLLHSRYTGDWYIVTEGWMNLDSVI